MWCVCVCADVSAWMRLAAVKREMYKFKLHLEKQQTRLDV